MDIFQILCHNLGYLVVFTTCSMFDKNITWTKQLSPLLGVREVQKLDAKLRYLNVTDFDSLCLTFNMFFPNHQQKETFGDLVVRIGSWAKVIFPFLFRFIFLLFQDEVEHTLLSLVILFCPDMLNLTERRKDFQLKFATLLQNYLKVK